VVQALEGVTQMIDCADPPCALSGRCRLKGMLDQAQGAFFASLNQYTLADMVAAPTGEAIVRLVARPMPLLTEPGIRLRGASLHRSRAHTWPTRSWPKLWCFSSSTSSKPAAW
jgi:hypothetical protein